MKNNYAKSSLQVINICEEALLRIITCQFGTTKCAPNDSDFDKVRNALYEIAEYKESRNIK
jgi:hypothetical protein